MTTYTMTDSQQDLQAENDRLTNIIDTIHEEYLAHRVHCDHVHAMFTMWKEMRRHEPSLRRSS